MIYAVQLKTGGPVKFGRARNVKHRLSQLQISHPKELILLAQQETDDDKYAETTIHAACAQDRIRGEWFRPSRLIKRFVRAIGREEWHRAWAYQIVKDYQHTVLKYDLARLLRTLRAYHAKSVH